MLSLDKASVCLNVIFWMLPAELQKSKFIFETPSLMLDAALMFGWLDFTVSCHCLWCCLPLSPLITQEFSF